MKDAGQLTYQSGFGNELESEAEPGALVSLRRLAPRLRSRRPSSMSRAWPAPAPWCPGAAAR